MEEFIKILTEQMRCAKARDGVARELANHIIDQTDAYEQAGMEHSKAIEKAVREMGDPVEIGVSMDRIHRPQTDWKMLLLIFVLSIAGLVCMLPVYGMDYVLSRQSLFTLAGFAVIAAVYFVDYSVLGRIGVVAYIALTIFFIISKHFMQTVNGRIPAMSILVYLYVPIYAGILYQLRMRGYRAVILGLATIGVSYVAVLSFASTALVALNIVLIMTVMLFAAIGKGMFGKQKRQMTVIVAVAVIVPILLFVGYVIANADRMSFKVQRLYAFIHRVQYKTGSAYLYGVIDDVLKNAKFIGAGTSQYFEEIETMLPGELIPLSAIYAYGIVVGILLLVLFAALTLRMFGIVRCQKNQLGFLVSMSCFLVLFVNCLEGVLENVGWFPLTTIVIPFLTRGGNATVVYSVLVGLLLGVHRYEKVYTMERYEEQPRWRVSLKVEKR